MNRKEKDIIRAYLRAIRYASHLESRIRIVLVGDTGTGESGYTPTVCFRTTFCCSFISRTHSVNKCLMGQFATLPTVFPLPKSYFYVIINGAMGCKAVALNINHCVTVWTI